MRLIYVALVFMMLIVTSATAQPDPLWTHVFSPSIWNDADDVIQTLDGGFIFSGHSSENFGNSRLWIVKTDQDGTQQWEISWQDSVYTSVANALVRTTDEHALIVVGCNSATTYATRFLKIANTGNIVWTNEFDEYEENWVWDCSSTSDGGFICCGSAGIYPNQMDGLLLKLDSEGNTEWHVRFDKAQDLIMETVYQTEDGGYIAAGKRKYSSTHAELLIVKTDSAGSLQWELELGDSSYNMPKTIRPAIDGGAMLLAAKVSNGFYRQWLLKFSESGSLEWDTLWAASDNAANRMELASDGHFLLTGATASGSSANLWLAKINQTGDIIWETVVENEYPTGGMCLTETDDYGYVVGATYQPYGATLDTWLVRFAAPEGIESGSVSDVTSIVSITPNPSVSEVSIGYQVSESGILNLSVYDLSGRLVDTLVNQHLDCGSHTCSWNPDTEITEGCYLIVLQSENGRSTEKCLRIQPI